jgi:hypothetical protein
VPKTPKCFLDLVVGATIFFDVSEDATAPIKKLSDHSITIKQILESPGQYEADPTQLDILADIIGDLSAWFKANRKE